MSSNETTTTTTATSKPDLLDCDALMLSSYLLHHRFDGNAMDTASFLLEATSTLPNAKSLSAQLMMGQQQQEVEEKETKEAAAATVSFDIEPQHSQNALTEAVTVSMTTPRGKFQMTLLENGIHCVNAKNQVLQITPQAVERLVMFPKPEDCRKTTKTNTSGDMVLLCLADKASTQFNGKQVTQVCFQLSNEPPALVKGGDSNNKDNNTTWLELLCSSLDLNPKTQVAMVPNPKSPTKHMSSSSSNYTFKSHDEGTTSSTTAGMPFVQCYHGVKDGVLYPMEEGLLFFKPPMFLHRSSLNSIACGRGSGGSSRYVDLQLTLEDDQAMEFTNINREELVHLNDYIHNTLIPAMKRDALVQDEHEENDGNVQDEHDDEQEPSSLGKRKRTQRKASKEARLATKAHMERTQDEENDSDDDGWEGGQGDDDSDDEDDEEDCEQEEEEGPANDAAMDDDEEEEEFFEEEDSGTATESDDNDD